MKAKKALQKFDPAKLKTSRKFTTEEAVKFLEEFKDLAANKQQSGKSKLISIKIPEALLTAFRSKADHEGRPYQRVIKDLMWQWLGK